MASLLKIDEIKERVLNTGINILSKLKFATVVNYNPIGAPSNPVKGDIYLDSSDNTLKIYTGVAWKNIVDASPVFNVEYLVVAGGGSGGAYLAGGGGAGGLRTNATGQASGGGNTSGEATFNVVEGTTYTVTVGAGGAAATYAPSSYGNPGTNSVFDSIISIGGGRGADYSNPTGLSGGPGGSGGAGGGGEGNMSSGGSGTANQGFAGGGGNNSGYNAAGGGGGAGSTGSNSSGNNGGAGGVGLSNNITGTATFYAGGGGGHGQTGGAGGNGGGVQGSSNANATVNTGGGSGGGDGSSNTSGNGAKGIVIISYLNSYPNLTFAAPGFTIRGTTTKTTTGSDTVPPNPSTSRSGYKTYEFLDGDGTIRW